MAIDLDLAHVPPPPKRKDFRIGAIGAGFIMNDCHLLAYGHAGYNVVAIASASRGIETSGAVTRNLEGVRHVPGVAG